MWWSFAPSLPRHCLLVHDGGGEERSLKESLSLQQSLRLHLRAYSAAGHIVHIRSDAKIREKIQHFATPSPFFPKKKSSLAFLKFPFACKGENLQILENRGKGKGALTFVAC